MTLRPVLEFFARGYPPAWLLLSELEQEISSLRWGRAAECIRRYLSHIRQLFRWRLHGRSSCLYIAAWANVRGRVWRFPESG